MDSIHLKKKKIVSVFLKLNVLMYECVLSHSHCTKCCKNARVQQMICDQGGVAVVFHRFANPEAFFSLTSNLLMQTCDYFLQLQMRTQALVWPLERRKGNCKPKNIFRLSNYNDQKCILSVFNITWMIS